MKRNHLDRVLAQRLRSLPPAERVVAAEQVAAELGHRFDSAVADVLLAELGGTPASALAGWPETPTRAWLTAQLEMNVGHSEPAAAAWRRFLELRGASDPKHLLAYARCLADAGAPGEAVAQLRLALSRGLSYPQLAGIEKLVDRVAAAAADSVRECRVAILGTSTTALLIPVLRAFCLRDRIRASFYEGLYGALEQEILDPASGLARFRPNIVFLLGNWRDLKFDVAGSADEWIEEQARRLSALWQRLSDSFPCHVVQHTFGFPAADPDAYLATVLPRGRTRLIERLNLRLREVAGPGVSLLDTPALQRECGNDNWSDEVQWARYRQHPGTAALPRLAEEQMAHLRAVLGLTKKVLVTDLDNTLWGGIIGEDGLSGIRIGPGSPEGEAHQDLQRYLLALKTRGVLLAVCSKNNPDDARLPFEKHENMLLKLDDFAVFRANWEDKASNIAAAARELSLGLDSFVFLDDNPLEREWVRTALPQVAVPDLGESVFHFVRELDRARYFFSLSLSEEDLQRSEQYRIAAARQELRGAAGSLEEFLAQLQLRAAARPITDANLARVTQLINKTNQFNLTTRRYTEADVRRLASDPECWAVAFELSDRMGAYGLIGVILCVPGEERCSWRVDTWLMSCRALGRQMERFMFDRLVEAAQQRGVRRLMGTYRPTAKNGLVKDLYDQLGWERRGASDSETLYELAVPAGPVRTATHVEDETR
ncbi:MAG TPA: HAD-IIIC family phosphatase [Bryobacteraceae bacterium]|nr:HAD-IIIC family phosphatase [Bryobacteraceae bacterium]